MFQVTQDNIEGRLRLLRYGLVVVVITTFIVSFASQFAVMNGLPGAPGTGALLLNALLWTVVVGVISAVLYFGYSFLLNKMTGENSETASQE